MKLWPLARVSYLEGLARMEAARQQAQEGLFFFEHPSTFTLGNRSQPEDFRLPTAALQAEGHKIVTADRGGRVTWHGPGQLVVYPVLPVPAYGVRTLVRWLTDACLSCLADLSIQARYEEAAPGVWVQDAKIAALGLSVRNKMSGHGLALNVSCDLAYTEKIRPCGLDRAVTSVQTILGHAPTLEELSLRLAEKLCALRFTL